MGAELLSNDEVGRELGKLPGWGLYGGEIRKTFEFPGFTEAMGFTVSVALLAEKANHHPDIDVRWNKVTLALSTHSAGGLTAKDFSLASKIEGLG
jgi:4a-hydroxytetrahydrobiopterin dehydratase